MTKKLFSCFQTLQTMPFTHFLYKFEDYFHLYSAFLYLQYMRVCMCVCVYVCVCMPLDETIGLEAKVCKNNLRKTQ